MKKTIVILLLLLSFPLVALAPPSLRSRSSQVMRNKTSNFNNLLSSSDTNAQKAFDTIDNMDGTFTIDTTGTVTTGVHQFGDSDVRFERTNSILKLYVNNKLIHQWEDISAVSFALLSDGVSFILLSDGTSKLKLS